MIWGTLNFLYKIWDLVASDHLFSSRIYYRINKIENTGVSFPIGYVIFKSSFGFIFSFFCGGGEEV